MKKNSYWIFLFAIIFSACNVGGERVKGNGNVITEIRKVSDFSNVNVSGDFKVIFSQGEVAPANGDVKVIADENLLPYIIVKVAGDELDISTKDGYSLKANNRIEVHISSAVYKSINASGACKLVGNGMLKYDSEIRVNLSGACDATFELDAPSIRADLSGACTINLRGACNTLALHGSGSSDFKCVDMLAENNSVNISGAGDAEVFASVKLNVEISGAGTVKYKGNPAVGQSISGAGSVKKIE